MGLLDEAIREHLELKRRGGADPTAVQLAEQEALAPVSPDADAAPDAIQEDLEYAAPAQEPAAERLPPVAAPVHSHQGADPSFAELSSVGQDTAELDMRAVLAEGTEAAGTSSSPLDPVRAGAQAAYAVEDAQEDALGWEIAREREAEPPPADIPGQERLSFE
jgi:hypothetical protein